MKCPQCGSACLRVEITFTGRVDCDFGTDDGFPLMEPVELDSKLGAGDGCGCLSCDWQGTVQDAELAAG